MISVEEARRRILAHTPRGETEILSLERALGRVSAQTLLSPRDLPPFPTTAMDGFSLRSRETRRARRNAPAVFRLLAPAAAGSSPPPLPAGGAVLLATGAPLPRGADAVVEMERARSLGNTLRLHKPVAPGRNVRPAGSALHRGEVLLRAGERLTSRLLGLLASAGVARVAAARMPAVGLLVTGDELLPPGRKLPAGRIHDANTTLLTTALREAGVRRILRRRAPDRRGPQDRAFRFLAARCDFLLISGGASVGGQDLSKTVLESAGVRRVFWRVRQKPGFPLYFGIFRGKPVFVLPGNPAAAWICLFEHVRPALDAFQGLRREPFPRLPWRGESLAASPKTRFLKAVWEPEFSGAFPLEGQDSHVLVTLASARGLAVVPAGRRAIRSGDFLEVHPFTEGGAA